MSAIPYADDVLDPSVSLLQFADVAKILDVPKTRVEQLVRDRQLLALKRSRVPGVPEQFFDTTKGEIVRACPACWRCCTTAATRTKKFCGGCSPRMTVCPVPRSQRCTVT